MFLTDFFPDKKTYDEPIQHSETALQRQIEDDNRSYKQLENGDILGAVGLIMSWYCDKNRREETLTYCEMILAAPSTCNSHSMAYYVKASLCITYEKYDEAIEILLKGREENPHNDFILQSLFHIYYHLKDYDKALEAVLYDYTHYHAKFYTDTPLVHEIEYCYKIGLCYGFKEDFEKALEWFQLGLTDEKGSKTILAQVYYSIGLCWQRFNDEYRARAAYKKSIEANPEMPEVYTNLATLAFNNHGNVQEAIELHTKAIELFENNEDEFALTIWKNLQCLYATIADYDNAAYAKYKVLCCMGFGFLYQDPSKPASEYEIEEEEFDEMDDDDFDLESM
jgi:tetratricopeptide (TPR) repeat protein